MKNSRSKAGRRASNKKAGKRTATPQPETPPPVDLTPLDYALRIMRDETQATALRASMAKAAMPYLHRRAAGDEAPDDEPDEKPPMSDLEVARRIAHILMRAETGNPVEKPANTRPSGAVPAKTS